MLLPLTIRAAISRWVLALTYLVFSFLICPAQAGNAAEVSAQNSIDIEVDDLAHPGQTTENSLILSTAQTPLDAGSYRVTVNFAANVCPKDGVSPIVLDILYHDDSWTSSEDAFEPSSYQNCKNGILEFEFDNRNLGLSELNFYTRRVISLGNAPILEQLVRADGLQLTTDFAIVPGETKENQLVLSTLPSHLDPGSYRVAIKFGANVCKNDGVSPIVLNILSHSNGAIAGKEAFEPSSSDNCENGILTFDFTVSGTGSSELNLYSRRHILITQPPELESIIKLSGEQSEAVEAKLWTGTSVATQVQTTDVRSGRTIEAPIQAPQAESSAQTPAPEATSPGRKYLEEAGPYLNFIRDHLGQKITSGPLAGLKALAETEKPMDAENNIWFWTDDNAKALEAFLVPEAYAHYQNVADSLLTFVRRMSEGPIILRRIAKPTLNIKSRDPENFRVSTGLMNYHGNLRRGEIALSYQFHDGRDVDAVRISANWIHFDFNGRTYEFDVEDSITSSEILERDGLVILKYVSDLNVSSTQVARVTYSYAIDPALTLLKLNILVEAQNGANLTNIQVTSSMDRLSDLPQGIAYHEFCAMRLDKLSCKNATEGERTILAEGALDWFSLIQLGNLGFSYAIHVQPVTPRQLIKVVAEETRADRFHRVYAVYGIERVSDTAPGRVSEVKLLTSGGLYQSMEVYGDLIRMAGQEPGLDLSASYDYGAELNAMGCYYMFANSGRYEPLLGRGDPKVAGLKDLFDRHLRLFEHNFLTKTDNKDNPFPYLFGRGIAFTVLGADCMYRATGEARYLNSIKKMVDILLQTQRGEGEGEFAGDFRCNGADSYLDCQGAIILALSRAALVLDEPRLGSAVIAGVNAVKMERWRALEDSPIVVRGDSKLFINVSPSRAGERDGMLWGFKAGLLLRGLAAAELAADAGKLDIDQHTRWYMRELAAAATDYLNTSTVPRGKSLEILTSYRSGETNSESQPWMLLGLFPIDPIIAQVQPPGSGAP
jgi:hypothetical protein